jgi:hypothetical protein
MYDWAFELWICMGGETWQYFRPRAEREGEREWGGARERESALTHAGEKQGERNNRGMFTKKSVTDSTLSLLLGVF